MSIGGNLTVNGDTLRVGSAPPFARLQRVNINFATLSFNWDRIAVASDLAAFDSPGYTMLGLAPGGLNQDFAPAGNPAGGVSLASMLRNQFSLLQDLMVMGTASPFVRLARRLGAGLLLSWNLAQDLATRDSVTREAEGYQTIEGDRRWLRLFMNPAGTLVSDQFPGLSQGSIDPVAHTGTVTEDTLNSITVPANLTDVRGGLRFMYFLNLASQGAVATTVRVRFGGQIAFTIGRAVVDNLLIIGSIWQKGTSTSQRADVAAIGNATGSSATDNNLSVDTTLAQPLILTVQNGATTDSQNLFQASVESFLARAVI